MQIKTPMTVLLVTQDRSMMSALKHALCALPIRATECTDLNNAQTNCETEHFDCVIIDWDRFKEPGKIVSALRLSAKNAKSTVLGYVEHSKSFAKAMKASVDLVVYKFPENTHTIHCIKPLVSLLLRKQRNTERVSVKWNATVTYMLGMTKKGIITDVSHGGIGMNIKIPAHTHENIKITFQIPGTMRKMTVSSSVIWHSMDGAMGARFIGNSMRQHASLDHWLATEVGNKTQRNRKRNAVKTLALSA